MESAKCHPLMMHQPPPPTVILSCHPPPRSPQCMAMAGGSQVPWPSGPNLSLRFLAHFPIVLTCGHASLRARQSKEHSNNECRNTMLKRKFDVFTKLRMPGIQREYRSGWNSGTYLQMHGLYSLLKMCCQVSHGRVTSHMSLWTIFCDQTSGLLLHSPNKPVHR